MNFASRASPAGRPSDLRPASEKHAAPSPAPAVKPMIMGQVSFARRRASADSWPSFPNSASPASTIKRVRLVVIVENHSQRYEHVLDEENFQAAVNRRRNGPTPNFQTGS